MDRPAIQLYLSDLSSNARYRECSWGARGVFNEVMLILHDSEHYGAVHYDLRKLSRVVRAPYRYIKELAESGVLKGSDCDDVEPLVYRARHAGQLGEPVILIPAQKGPLWYSARMVRDEYIRQKRAVGGGLTVSPKDGIGGGIGVPLGGGAGALFGDGIGEDFGVPLGASLGEHPSTCAPAYPSSSSSSSSSSTAATAANAREPELPPAPPDDDWQAGFSDDNVIQLGTPRMAVSPQWQPGETIGDQILLRAGVTLTAEELEWLRREFVSYRASSDPLAMLTQAQWDHRFVQSVQRNLAQCRRALSLPISPYSDHVQALRAKTTSSMESRRTHGRKTRLDAVADYDRQLQEMRQHNPPRGLVIESEAVRDE